MVKNILGETYVFFRSALESVVTMDLPAARADLDMLLAFKADSGAKLEDLMGTSAEHAADIQMLLGFKAESEEEGERRWAAANATLDMLLEFKREAGEALPEITRVLEEIKQVKKKCNCN